MKKVILIVIGWLFISNNCYALELINPVDNIKTRIEIKKLSKEIDKNKDNPYLFFERGNRYWRIKKDHDAEIDFYVAYDIKPDFWEAYMRRAFVYYFNKEYGWAFEIVTELINKNPDYQEAYDLRAKIYHQFHDYKNYINDKTKVLELDNSNYHCYYFIGYAYQQLGDYNHAIENYKKFLEKSNDNEDSGYISTVKESLEYCYKEINN